MTIFSPEQVDFNQIIEDVGQIITIRTVTRTINDDGLVTAVSNSDSSTSAIVEEIDAKKFNLIQSGYYDVGDVRFFIDPDITVNIFDKVVWNNEIYGVKELNYPPMIGNHYAYLEVHGVRDSEV